MSWPLKTALAILLVLHLLAAFAGFFAPHSPSEQYRDHAWQPPNPDLRAARFFVEQDGHLRLLAAQPGQYLFLLGTDGLGRDQFSRLLFGARVSLFSGLFAALISAILGGFAGSMGVLLGRGADRLIMGIADLFLALPWMYLLLAARAFFPIETNPRLVFISLIALLGLIGWSRPARLARGIAFSVRQRDYVLAARGFGASIPYVLRRHLIPEMIPVLGTYLSLAIPQYVLAEATLSFIGLGFSGSIPSWGSLLASIANLDVLENYWWMLLPAIPFAAVFACYNVIVKNLRAPETSA